VPIPQSVPVRYFLLSPASIAGVRGQLLTGSNARSALATRLRGVGVPLAELFTFISSLYFRAKLQYARRFATPPPGGCGVFVITGCGGLVPPDTVVTLEKLWELSSVDFDPADSRYRDPSQRDAKRLLQSSSECEAVLLGSIATAKYVNPLVEIFGDRLIFPNEFVGRGDMSRGGLMLRAVESGIELEYASVRGATRCGRRPPRLPPARRIQL
jgi:hypothetical protein